MRCQPLSLIATFILSALATGSLGARFPITHRLTPSHWRGGAGQAHRRWKMCDGWPAGPAPSRFYSTPIALIARLPLVPASPSSYTAALAAPSAKGRGHNRCTVPGSTLNRSAILRTPGLPEVARASDARGVDPRSWLAQAPQTQCEAVHTPGSHPGIEKEPYG